MTLEKVEETMGALKESNDSGSYLPSMRGSTLEGDTPPRFIPGEDEMPKPPQVATDLSDAPAGNDPFDTNSPSWNFGRYLAASLKSVDDTRMRPPSADMSVLFDNLRVMGAGLGATYQDSVGETARTSVEMVQSLLSQRKDPKKMILHGVDGVDRAVEKLLILGRPGSGCSTLLKNLAGFSEGYIRVEGGIKYNGVDVDIIKHRFRADVAYNAEGLFHWLRFRCMPLTRYSGGKLPTSYILQLAKH
jgi:hypothetical protein